MPDGAVFSAGQDHSSKVKVKVRCSTMTPLWRTNNVKLVVENKDKEVLYLDSCSKLEALGVIPSLHAIGNYLTQLNCDYDRLYVTVIEQGSFHTL